MPDPSDIREAYADYIKNELYQLDQDLGSIRTVTRYRNFRDTSRATRISIMGEDLYFMDVLPADEPTSGLDRDYSGVYHRIQHPMVARAFYRYRDADTASGASQSRFDTIVSGIMRATLATDGGVRTSGLMASDQLRQPDGVVPAFDEDVITLGAGRRDEDLAHVLTINLTLMENSRSSAG